MSKLLRRRSLFLLAGSGVAVATLSGCDEISVLEGEGDLTPTPSTPLSTCGGSTRTPLPDIGVAVPHNGTTCGPGYPVTHTRADKDNPVDRWGFQQYVVYLLPDDYQPATREEPINGRHGWFRSPAQLPTGSELGWGDQRIRYAKQEYKEYTNSENIYTDYYAFISFDRPPVPGHSVLTLRWDHYDASKRSIEEDLRRIAGDVVLLSE